jgi:hypothetical protein
VLARSPSDDSTGPPAERAELPRGGASILPESRVVAFYGAPKARDLGILGIGTPAKAGKGLVKRARAYDRPDRPVLPAMELISTLVLSAPGKQHDYAKRLGKERIDGYLEAARKIKALLILDIQPGHADFLEEAKALEPYLRQPDIGLALDPEWKVGRHEVPGEVLGQVSAQTVNEVGAYLSEIVERDNLPDKLLVVHQFTRDAIRHKSKLRPSPGIELVLNADGFGAPPDKRDVYRRLAPDPGGPFFRGFKLFHAEDTELMKPKAVLGLRPRPVDFVVYE